MKHIHHLFCNICQKTIGRLFVCAKLYRIDLLDFEITNKLVNIDQMMFVQPTQKEWPLFEKFFEGNQLKLAIVKKRFDEGHYICFAYQDQRNWRIAYARWLCLNSFYSETMKRLLIFKKNEALTLDSYTNSDYRYLGLHKNMNILMLQWIKDNTEIRYVYMVIKCFIPHLTKIPLSLGYKPIQTTFYYKKGSISLLFVKLIRKVL